MGEGYDYSWLEKKKEKLIESGAADFMTSSLKGGSLISDFLLSLGWEVMDSLADQDISPSKKKLINQAIYEWNIRVNNNYISIMDFAIGADIYDNFSAKFITGTNVFTESVITTVLGFIDKSLCGGVPITNIALSPELPRYKEGDAMLKMIALYKYNDSATKNSTLNFGSFGQGQSWIDKIFHNVPCENIKNYYVTTIELQLRDSKIIDATWSLTEYYYYQLNREFKPMRSIKIP